MSPLRLIGASALAVVLASLVLAGLHRLLASAGEQRVAPSRLRIALDDESFGPGVRRTLRVVAGDGDNALEPPFRCRWVPAHTDVGLITPSASQCVAIVYIDPERTRRSRFELDPWMSVDAIVSHDGRRVGIASTRLHYAE